MEGKKSKASKTKRKENRLQKARQWITTYNGTLKHMAKHYKKRFNVDIVTAVRDLQEIGVEFPQGYLDAVKQSEEERIYQKHLAKEKKAQQDFLHEDSDDEFAFIAGYTGGGVPYGITWEELELEPYASYDELMEAYDRLYRQRADGLFED